MPPLTVMVKPVSGACNMRCGYCFYADVSNRREVKSYGMMDDQTLETLVRRAFAYADECVSFAFQGGEPTLAGIGFYEKLVEFQKKYNGRGIAVHNAIQTNGYDVPDEMMRFFAKERFLVGVSLDGTPENHDRLRVDATGKGSHDRVRACLERFLAHGVECNVLCVVNRYVAEAAGETFDALAKYGYLQFIPMIDDFSGIRRDASLTEEAYGRFLTETFLRYFRAYKSGKYVSVRNFDNYIGILLGRAPENCAMQGECGVYYLVEGDGGVYPCDFYVLDRWRLGNIREDSFARLEKSPVAEAFRIESRNRAAECGNCEWFRLCRGGCKRDREPVIDGVPASNRFCGAYRRFFQDAYPRMVEMAREIGMKQR